MPDTEESGVRALIVDWGGVLTNDLSTVMDTWTLGEDFEAHHFAEVISTWFGRDAGVEAEINPIQVLERGEMTVPDFESKLAEELSRTTGRDVSAAGLLDRLFGHFEHAPEMTALVRRAHEQGIRTGLLSNSWGDHYPEHLFDGMFDAVVISGRVGMRKPEPRIFQYTLDLLQVTAAESVFVDDLAHNIAAARELGFVAVHHRDYQSTQLELSAIFGRDLGG